MTGRGRPTTGVKVQVRIPGDVLAVIDKRAADREVTRAEYVRRVLAEHAGIPTFPTSGIDSP